MLGGAFMWYSLALIVALQEQSRFSQGNFDDSTTTLSFEGDLAEPAKQAFSKFLSQPHDHKGAQLADFIYSNGSVRLYCFLDELQFTEVKQVSFEISLFYDSLEPPAGLYDKLLNLSSTNTTIFKGNFTDFVSSQFLPLYDRVNLDSNSKCQPISHVTFRTAFYFDGVPMLRYTEPVMKAFTNETKVRTLDAFEPDFLTHGKPSAYPPNRSLAVFPCNLYLGWTKPSADKFMADAIRRSAASLFEAGIRDGQDLKNAATYVNYALFGTPLKAMYGNQLERLREIRKSGWKF
ncbi:hypothetical protein F5888DRAFT_1889188 [Russula emetica]|nr:hypothetical protein F5888DRAFT_1889188 [Russula emetica]